MRLDIFLVQNGYVPSRSKAKELIEKGSVYVHAQKIQKPAFEVEENATVTLKREDICPFVSRGGLKLDHALKTFQISVKDKVCLDIGASTGGFTDCMLQNGAAKIYALDCGKDQLHTSLRLDERVTVFEGYNAKQLNPVHFQVLPVFVSIDVSFISQTLILPSLFHLLPYGSEIVTLIKPQFELTKASLSKKGIVKNEKDRHLAIQRVKNSILSLGFTYKNITNSPISGGDGNTEYLVYFTKDKKEY